MKYEESFKDYLGLLESKMKEVLPPADHPPVRLHEAMRYAVLEGGKRFRPVMAFAACEACGGKPEQALIPAVSIELIHSYSLVHDDLPALDNDELRRGMPTLHMKYGEALAVLTGDALLTLAMQLLSGVRPPKLAASLLHEISTAAGSYGMIGGQVADLEAEGRELDVATLDYINVHKTGKLIRTSASAGAMAAGAGRDDRTRLNRYGEFTGLAFQAVDDLLDHDGYLQVMKPGEVKEQVRDLIAKAKREIRPLGKKAGKLIQLADFLLERMPKEALKNVSVDS